MNTAPTATDVRTLAALRHASPESLFILTVSVNGEDRVAICCKQKVEAGEHLRVLAYLPKKEDEVLVQPLLLLSEDKSVMN